MSLATDVLAVLTARGAMSNAELREALALDASDCTRVSVALKDLRTAGRVAKLPPDSQTPQRYEAVVTPVAAPARAVKAVQNPASPWRRGISSTLAARTAMDDRDALSLRAEACVMLLTAGAVPMPAATHERLLSLIARAEFAGSVPGSHVRAAP